MAGVVKPGDLKRNSEAAQKVRATVKDPSKKLRWSAALNDDATNAPAFSFTATTPGLYRVRISSEHTAKIRNDSERIPSGQIDLVALARSPEDLLESLRAARARYGAPAAAAIERS